MFRTDLADARRRWLDSAGDNAEERSKRKHSDFLAATDHHGRRAIFYSLRHSHRTALGAAGIPQKDIQASLNHTRSSTTESTSTTFMRKRGAASGEEQRDNAR